MSNMKNLDKFSQEELDSLHRTYAKVMGAVSILEEALPTLIENGCIGTRVESKEIYQRLDSLSEYIASDKKEIISKISKGLMESREHTNN